MADTFFIEGLNTLPEQVQLNKEDIKTNTDNIQRLGDLSDTYHDQIQSLNTKVSTNTANIATNTNSIATNATNIDNLSKKVYDNGTISFYLDSDKFYFKDEGSKQVCYLYHSSANSWFLKPTSFFTIDGYVIITEHLSVEAALDTKTLTINSKSIDNISDSNTTDRNTLLTGKAINDTFLSKTDASSTYATINALKPLQNSYFDADLTPAGLAKIQANATIGTSITLVKDTDFIESITNNDLSHRTVIFTLYRDNDEEVYISENIKLDIANTTDYYSDNDQPHIWFTGLGVIKLGSASAPDNNYLCYIAYDTTSTRGLMITPVQKLN